jgi:hypothetical protein
MATLFDSDSIPLVTRVEAGPGIIVTYNSNDDEEGVWKATLDSDYVVEIINRKINDSDFLVIKTNNVEFDQRIIELERLLGVNYVNPFPFGIPVEDSDTFRTIVYTQSSLNLAGELKIRWKIISFDGGTLVSKDLTFAAGSTYLNILNALMYSLKSDTLGSKYINSIRFDDGTKIYWSWRPGFENMKIQIDVLQTSDTIKFTINQ